MSRKIDIINQKFGRLTVLYELPKEQRPSKNRVYWHCRCDCGNECDVESYHLRKGQIVSCGCYAKEKFLERNQSEKHKIDVSNNKTINEVGNRYGKLVVLEKADNRRKGAAAWLCQCDCGNKVVISGMELRRGDTKSCGCIKSYGEYLISQYLLKHNIKYETQKTFQDCIFPATQSHLYFDFLIDNKMLLEMDGQQHYDKTNSWYREGYDQFKDNWAKEHNIPLIRIKYNELKNINLILERVLKNNASINSND
jgi:very-short-patch-repair endonuclease